MIYLDSAATTLQKPSAVAEAVRCAIVRCASPGRGLYHEAMEAAETVYECRREAATLFGVKKPENVVFTMNATHALNIAIRSVVRPGMRVAISGFEHNAVVRPLKALGAETTVVRSAAFSVEEILEGFQKALPGAEAAVCTHVSNVFGFVLPIREIAAACREYGVPLIVDASQSAGSLPLNAGELGARFIAMPGHKGLLGPQGTGILLCDGEAAPLLYGGTGVDSLALTMPEQLPERLEAGTLNVCGIAGLREGIRFVRRLGTESIHAREVRLTGILSRRLASSGLLRVFNPPEENRAGVLSVIPLKGSCEELGDALGSFGIAVRTGLHCAPLAHQTVGTLSTGTVRLSVSPFTAEREIGIAVETINKILKDSYRL